MVMVAEGQQPDGSLMGLEIDPVKPSDRITVAVFDVEAMIKLVRG
ncbi:MAG: hypothetical protein ACJA09_003693 [Alcanivorax sp.]|jgi:hypothetical protein